MAISAARVVRIFGFEPKVAVSFNFGQPSTSRTKHIKDAVEILKKKVDFEFDGDIADVALNEEYRNLPLSQK